MKLRSREVTLKARAIKMAAALVGIYRCLVAAFYYLAGEQLHLRQSRGELTMPPAEAGTVELSQGTVVEQRFTMQIQRLERIEVQWSTYYRPNTGTAVMELWDERSGELLLTQRFDVSAIPEGGVTVLTAEAPLEGLYEVPLLLRVYADSPAGSAASPLMSLSGQREEAFLMSNNGEAAEGVLGLSAYGAD